MPQSKYLPEKLWPINLSLSLIKDCMASVIWISPPLPGLSFDNLLKIVLGNIYLPITALLDGASLIEGFSTTLLIIKFLLLIFF